MKKLLFFTIFVFALSLIFPTFSFAHGTATSVKDNDHTAREETEGKEIWEKLQAEESKCEDLFSDDFESLGMYFMGLMTGDSHEAMDTMMENMVGENGEKHMHIAMGKRMSGCEPDAPMPQNMTGGGMMQMMMGGSMMGNSATNPTSWFGWDLGWVFMILFWGLAILGIVALIKWLMNRDKREAKSKSALDILKERYAKSEIDKKEFEDKKKDLS